MNLHKKFALALGAVIVITLLMLLTARLLAKGALFHRLERDHIVGATALLTDLERVRAGALRAGFTKTSLNKDLLQLRTLPEAVNVELFDAEVRTGPRC